MQILINHSFESRGPVGGPGFGRPVAGANSADAAHLPSLEQKVCETVGYMLSHLDEPLQVARLAAMANVSPSHYFALFKRQTGCSPIHFFTRLRMRKAEQLLQDASLSVKEVASALGFDDPFYFSRVFKSFHNLAPSEYRALPPEAQHSKPSPALARSSARGHAFMTQP